MDQDMRWAPVVGYVSALTQCTRDQCGFPSSPEIWDEDGWSWVGYPVLKPKQGLFDRLLRVFSWKVEIFVPPAMGEHELVDDEEEEKDCQMTRGQI